MTPKTGQHVKCILRNGAVAEGIVEEWLTNEVTLRSLDGESILIITHPAEDIMLIKIALNDPVEILPIYEGPCETNSTEVVESPGVQYVRSELEQRFEQAKQLPSNDPMRIKTLAELRTMMIEQEKKIISEKVKNHYPSSAYDLSRRTRMTYGYPGFIKKPSTK